MKLHSSAVLGILLVTGMLGGFRGCKSPSSIISPHTPKFTPGDCVSLSEHRESWETGTADIKQISKLGTKKYQYRWIFVDTFLYANFEIEPFDLVHFKVECPSEFNND